MIGEDCQQHTCRVFKLLMLRIQGLRADRHEQGKAGVDFSIKATANVLRPGSLELSCSPWRCSGIPPVLAEQHHSKQHQARASRPVYSASDPISDIVPSPCRPSHLVTASAGPYTHRPCRPRWRVDSPMGASIGGTEGIAVRKARRLVPTAVKSYAKSWEFYLWTGCANAALVIRRDISLAKSQQQEAGTVGRYRQTRAYCEAGPMPGPVGRDAAINIWSCGMGWKAETRNSDPPAACDQHRVRHLERSGSCRKSRSGF